MSKTIREFLEELEEPFRSQALHNLGSQDSQYGGTISNSESQDIPSALSEGFIWFHSPEGHEYWEDLQDQEYSKLTK